jgi:FkbM family methyltransferase
MTPKLTIRSFSNDQYVLDKVFYSNFYRLKGIKEPELQPTVIDIGAHAGFFTFAALSLGAKKVHAIEPYVDNFKILIDNIESSDNVIPYNFGVYTENTILHFAQPDLIDGSYYDFANISINSVTPMMYHWPCHDLDTILGKIIKEKADILKINIGYAELDIIKSSESLSENVSNICIQTSESPEVVKEFVSVMGKKGYIDSFVQKIPEEENLFLVILSKDKCSTYFNIV